MTRVIIVGAGIAGNTLAIGLKKQGFEVSVYEKDSAPDETLARGKSINLAMSDRSTQFFTENHIPYPETVPMRARLIHTHNGLEEQRYNQFDKYLNSVNRHELNCTLYKHARELGVDFYFNHSLETLDSTNQKAEFRATKQEYSYAMVEYDYLFGTDGSNSKVAKLLDNAWSDDYQSVYKSPWCYQEYEITAKDHQFQLQNPEQFHIWPGDKLFLIALPNADKSFTVTLFCHEMSKVDLKSLQESKDLTAIQEIFESLVPKDELPLFNIAQDFLHNPVASIYTRKSKYWHENTAAPHVCLIGDAAHAFPPFLGLGMNAAVEDAAIFLNIPGELSERITKFAPLRKNCMQALEEASTANAEVLSSDTVDKNKQFKIEITEWLERNYLDLFQDPHTLYSFTHRPETEVRFRQLYQDDLLNTLVNNETLQNTKTQFPQISTDTLLTNHQNEIHQYMAKYHSELTRWWIENKDTLLLSPYLSKSELIPTLPTEAKNPLSVSTEALISGSSSLFAHKSSPFRIEGNEAELQGLDKYVK